MLAKELNSKSAFRDGFGGVFELNVIDTAHGCRAYADVSLARAGLAPQSEMPGIFSPRGSFAGDCATFRASTSAADFACAITSLTRFSASDWFNPVRLDTTWAIYVLSESESPPAVA